MYNRPYKVAVHGETHPYKDITPSNDEEDAAASVALTHRVHQKWEHNIWHTVNVDTTRGLQFPTEPKYSSATFVHINNIAEYFSLWFDTFIC
jgi:hypothetical protein